MKNAAKRIFYCKNRCRYSRKRATFCRNSTSIQSWAAELVNIRSESEADSKKRRKKDAAGTKVPDRGRQPDFFCEYIVGSMTLLSMKKIREVDLMIHREDEIEAVFFLQRKIAFLQRNIYFRSEKKAISQRRVHCRDSPLRRRPERSGRPPWAEPGRRRASCAQSRRIFSHG